MNSLSAGDKKSMDADFQNVMQLYIDDLEKVKGGPSLMHFAPRKLEAVLQKTKELADAIKSLRTEGEDDVEQDENPKASLMQPALTGSSANAGTAKAKIVDSTKRLAKAMGSLRDADKESMLQDFEET